MVDEDTKPGAGIWDKILISLEEELSKSNNQLSEIELMLEQSQLEVSKLAQRNATVTIQLQQIINQFDSMPRTDIRMAYESALDSQQRLFVMRGQLDKLESDYNHIKHHVATMEKFRQSFEDARKTPISKQTGEDKVDGDPIEIIVEAQEIERQRLSRQMHDGPAQALSNFILQTDIALKMFEVDQDKAKEELANLRSSSVTTFQKIRDYIFELRPMMLDDLGLLPTINRYVEALKDQSGLDIRYSVVGLEQRFEPHLEVFIFRSVQELLGNAIKHSQASQIKLQLDLGETDITVIVEDNGEGFDVESIEVEKSIGLNQIIKRVKLLGGSFKIVSNITEGTIVNLVVPYINDGKLS